MDGIFLLCLKSAYFLVPAYIANMAPPLVKKLGWLESLDVPIDKEKKLGDKRQLFGRNKTYRGFVVGVIGGAIGGMLQSLVYGVRFFDVMGIDGIAYHNIAFMIFFGALMGFGAIFGDLVESFIKRRLGIGPGKRFVPWDQTDLVVGAYLLVLPITFTLISWQLFLSSMVITFLLHILINHAAYYLDIRKERW